MKKVGPRTLDTVERERERESSILENECSKTFKSCSRGQLKKRFRDDSGITLIALIVTIMVLIILAGITLKITLGENGLISKGREARNKAQEMRDNTENSRDSLYGVITGNKSENDTPSEVEVNLNVTKTSDTSISATANATDTNSNIVSYTFYIRKLTENDSSYVMIKKSDKLANTVECTGLEENMSYTVKVIAVDEKGTSKTAVKKIALGNAVQIKVKPISGPDSYPSTVAVTATGLVADIDYIELPNGEQVKAKNGKVKLDTTYNSTKNGPVTFKAYDKDGNAGELEYDEENVINFETEWTIPNDNTRIEIPLWSEIDVYIDFGDGTRKNVKTSQLPSHVYEKAGTYIIKISGKCGEFYTKNNVSSKEYYLNYLTGIKKWGCLENSSYKFQSSNIKGSIPEPREKSFSKITSFYLMFSGCNKLEGNIPDKLFANCMYATDFNYTFSGCSSLTGEIPEILFANCSKVTSFRSTFNGCRGLKGTIEENLFANCPEATNFVCTFDSCSNLTGSIPENLFANCPDVTTFSSTFYYCSGLTGSIPENLFANCPDVTTFSSTFYNCSKLTGSISEKLFANCTNVTSFNSTFQSCKGLTGEIPENLFRNCQAVTDFNSTLSNCNGLTNDIPSNLFSNCQNVTNFTGTFYNCSGLTGNIPEELFSNCKDVTSFSNTFSGCSKLTGYIPENLFINCPQVTSFGGTFSGCSCLTGSIPSNLFVKCPKVTNFSGSFKSCTGLTRKYT